MTGRERATVVPGGCVDVSAAAGHASLARASDCVCGGVIVVLADEDIPFVVGQHNRSALHLFWRWRTGRVTLGRWLGLP